MILHQPQAQGRGAIPDLILQADEVVRIRSDIEGILHRTTGRSLASLRRDTDRGRVLTAPEAREFGLIDTVLEER